MLNAITSRIPQQPRRNDNRVIIHFDYDCFYASVFEAENPALRTLPLAVQQKQIIVTCNYVARARGLRKLQLITEAKKLCPEAVIVLGEDLTRFRDASKALYNFLRAFSWNERVERLGFDEVWLDVTDMIDYNMEILNRNDLSNSFFQLSKSDPTAGFLFDASALAGPSYPSSEVPMEVKYNSLDMRLILASHVAFHIRRQLEEQKGYTSTVGISTSKLISKLIGNVNKPRSQTTLIPPYAVQENGTSNVLTFVNDLDIGAIPGIGYKSAQKLREYVLRRPASIETGLIYGGSREQVTVKQVRDAALSPETIEKLLSGPGSPHDIGAKIYALLHGIDDSEVSEARDVPRQISIEDSYIRLDTMDQVLKELKMLSGRLIERMRIDLTETIETADDASHSGKEPPKKASVSSLKWIAYPRTLRLSTRPRLPLGVDGIRPRNFKRISRSTLLPSFVFSFSETVDSIAERLVKEALVPLLKRLHADSSGWNLSLVNVAVTGMGYQGKHSKTGDIGLLFRQRVNEAEAETDAGDTQLDEEEDHIDINEGEVMMESPEDKVMTAFARSEGPGASMHQSGLHDDENGDWQISDDDDEFDAVAAYECPKCENRVPAFARVAHDRYHELSGE